MTTKVIFNTDKQLKNAAMRAAKKQGITYSAFLNIATRAFVDKTLTIDIIGHDIAEARKGKRYSHEEVVRRLGL